MKSTNIFILFVLLIGLYGCVKQEDNFEVAKFITQLKSNQYNFPELPAFTPANIPALLKYRNETATITQFPRNPISSYFGNECKLGIYVLWTIESIRAVQIDSKNLIGRFPSQNAILALRDSPQLDLVFDDQSHKAAADAYYAWWYSFHIFKTKMKIDPLKDTKYLWH